MAVPKQNFPPQSGMQDASHLQPQASHAHAHASQSQQGDADPVSKFKLLLPRLKEALANLMKIAGHALHQASVTESSTNPVDEYQHRFEKSLEEFYAICDQIEINLRLALESHNQILDSTRYTPLPVILDKRDVPPSEGQSYQSYAILVKTQVTCAKELHDMLNDCARKLSEK